MHTSGPAMQRARKKNQKWGTHAKKFKALVPPKVASDSQLVQQYVADESESTFPIFLFTGVAWES